MGEWKTVSLEECALNPFRCFNRVKPLLTAQKPDGSFNTMTIGWGGLGVMWGKDVSYVAVRPQRHTFSFMQESPVYTLSFFGPEYSEAVAYCGRVSGRDTDKVRDKGLTPVSQDQGVYFDEANMVMICKKLYAQRFDPKCFTIPELDTAWYPQQDHHILYLGEVTSLLVKEGFSSCVLRP